LGDGLELDKPLGPLTTYGTGGAARYFLLAESAQQIARAVTAAAEFDLRFCLIGGGSNLLISDAGFDGLVVKVAVKGIKALPGNKIRCGAGEDLMALVEFAAESGMGGLEFAAGIYGTVGGAIYGNAGAYGGEIGRLVSELTLVRRDGALGRVSADYCRFGYRDSCLKQTGEIVAEADFALQSREPRKIREKVEEILKVRHIKFPPEGRSAGCFFKNIPDPREPYGKLPAGRLLEQVGAKGLAVGGARVFEGHANIIVNDGGATSRDIRALADILKKKVFEQFGIRLEEEVVQIGDI
jgi:UDP-N-acetylmuramate dehydrogenase